VKLQKKHIEPDRSWHLAVREEGRHRVCFWRKSVLGFLMKGFPSGNRQVAVVWTMAN
jgi:hypothetical protein